MGHKTCASFFSIKFVPNTFCSQNIQQVALAKFVHQHVYIFMQNVQRRLSISLGKYATVFQAEIYAVLACAYEIQTNVTSGKYVSICSDSQVALKALQATKNVSVSTTEPKGN